MIEARRSARLPDDFLSRALPHLLDLRRATGVEPRVVGSDGATVLVDADDSGHLPGNGHAAHRTGLDLRFLPALADTPADARGLFIRVLLHQARPLAEQLGGNEGGSTTTPVGRGKGSFGALGAEVHTDEKFLRGSGALNNDFHGRAGQGHLVSLPEMREVIAVGNDLAHIDTAGRDQGQSLAVILITATRCSGNEEVFVMHSVGFQCSFLLVLG